MDDIRWRQRFQNFDKAYNNFKLTLNALRANQDNIIYKMAIIQAYEMVFELSWNTMKDFLDIQGIKTNFPREVLKEAFAREIIEDGDIWIKMLDDRNLTAHAYDEEKANIVVNEIKDKYSLAIEQVYNYLKGNL
ncbi:MAG: HI0074 family nucleotidyltransferase substrate-binding subunit [Candidatus Gastranaerophilales bacterium]|nr:HI0074 family nucleotidyltransferase substrate-binding subunit [Candidatus Gastranaerophilales bacterium]